MAEKKEKKAKEPKTKEAKKKVGGLWSEFKAFISRGSVIDLAVGVVIGGAFSAIVTAVVNVLMSLATWGVPGGISSLVTVLPPNPLNEAAQKGLEGIGQEFATKDFEALAKFWGEKAGMTDVNAQLTYGTNILNGNYTKYGGRYVYNGAAVINWGAIINAAISFIIIAITLFVIIKIVALLRAKRAEVNAKLLEEYYTRHPEERPVPPEPGKPEPSQTELLIQIRDLLAAKEK